MASRIRRQRSATVVGASILLAVLLPSAVFAANADPNFCNEGMTTTFTMASPTGLMTTGTHRVQWRSEYTNTAGDLVIDDSAENEVTIDPTAPAYTNSVLIRLFRNTTLLKGGEVIGVDAMRPTQAARMYVNVSWLRDDQFFVGEFRLSFRYETTRNRWSDYITMPASPTTSFCPEQNSSLWQRQYGWE